MKNLINGTFAIALLFVCQFASAQAVPTTGIGAAQTLIVKPTTTAPPTGGNTPTGTTSPGGPIKPVKPLGKIADPDDGGEVVKGDVKSPKVKVLTTKP